MGQMAVTYPVGGWLDEIKKLPPITIANFPQQPGTATKSKPFAKGFRLEVPAMAGEYAVQYTLPEDMEIVSIAVAASGYADHDYWELYFNSDKVIETMYTREVPEAHALGAGSGVFLLPQGTTITMAFNNGSGTSKIVWFSLRFLRD